MRIAIPKETHPGEHRIPITPAHARKLHEMGAEVVVESGMGASCGFADADYVAAGATVSPDLEALLLACLAKRPADRPASAHALRDRLRACTRAGAWTNARAAEWWAQHRTRLQARHQQNRKTYIYTIAQTRDEFLDRVAARMTDGLVEDFGDRALAQFRRKLDEAPVPADGQAAVVHPVVEQPTVH